MKWYYVFIKGSKEQLRDYWILLIVLLLAPFFIFVYYLMIEAENPNFDILLVNKDEGGIFLTDIPVNLGDSLICFLEKNSSGTEKTMLSFTVEETRDAALARLKNKKADVLFVIPENFTAAMLNTFQAQKNQALFELAGNITDMKYIIGVVWTQELFNQFLTIYSGYEIPVTWTETQLGYSGSRSDFELYVPGLLILAIIMMMFSASAAFVREPETQTIKRLKMSNLSAISFLSGISLIQMIIAAVSVVLALLASIALGYSVIPGTGWYLVMISFITSVSIIAFSLLFAAFCRSIKDIAIVGTFPMLIFMFFTGAALPVGGGVLFSIGDFEFTLNGILSPTHAITALNKVLILGQKPVQTLPDIYALVVMTVIYFILGICAFNRRHIRSG